MKLFGVGRALDCKIRPSKKAEDPEERYAASLSQNDILSPKRTAIIERIGRAPS